MAIGGFEFQPTGLVPKPGFKPSFEDWDRVGHFLRYAHTGVQFWIGDWLNFGEGAYGEKHAQALEHTGYDAHTLQTYAWVARRVPIENRVEKVPFGHYANGIAAMPIDDQRAWVEKVLEGNLSQSELKAQLRLAKRAGVTGDVALPPGFFRVWYVDCPWQYDDSGVILPDGAGKAEAFTKAEGTFPTMTIEQLMAMGPQIEARTFEDAVMFFWVPSPLIVQVKPIVESGWADVGHAWGFTPKAQFIWDKDKHVYGHYNSVQHEHLIICTRGSCTPDAPTPMPDSVVKYRIPQKDIRHSSKPELFRQIITKLYTKGPYIELFGRDPVDGWTVFGNDPALTRDVEGNEVEQPTKPAKAKRGRKAKAVKADTETGEIVEDDDTAEQRERHEEEKEPAPF